MSNHARRRPEGHLPVESDDLPRRPRTGLLGWLFGSGSTDPNTPVEVGNVTSRPEGELLAGYLRDKGVHAIVSADDEGGLAPQLAATRRVRVLVKAADAKRARELLEEAG